MNSTRELAKQLFVGMQMLQWSSPENTFLERMNASKITQKPLDGLKLLQKTIQKRCFYFLNCMLTACAGQETGQ